MMLGRDVTLMVRITWPPGGQAAPHGDTRRNTRARPDAVLPCFVRVQVPPPAFTKRASDAGFRDTNACWGPAGAREPLGNRRRDTSRRLTATRLVA